ncbi:MAG: PAS domain-containing sensor histidine kinase [Pseudomonadota bacterium]
MVGRVRQMVFLERTIPGSFLLREPGRPGNGVFGIVVVLAAMISAVASFVILIGLTSIQPTSAVTTAAIVINGAFVIALMLLIGIEVRAVIQARRNRKAASRLHVRIVTLFAIIATIPAIIVAIVASITLDLGLDRWFEIRTRTIVQSSEQVAQSYINENAVNLRDATINMAFALDQQRRLFNLDRNGFRQFLTQQARGRGMVGASVLRTDGSIIQTADIETERPLPLPPDDALQSARDGRPVIIPPGSTNLVGAMIKLREIPDTMLYTIRTVDPSVLDAVRLMQQNREEYQGLESNRGNLQLAFAILYFALALILLLAAIWTAIAVANRLVRPIRQLINASDDVGQGNLDVRVPVRSSDGDVGHLAETFNSMLGQLKSQRDEILHAKDLIDERRRFSEAVLAGVSAGVLGVNDKQEITIHNDAVADVLGVKEVGVGMSLSDVSGALADVFSSSQAKRIADSSEQLTFIDRAGRERVINVQIALDLDAAAAKGDAHHTHVVTIDDISDVVDAQRSTAWGDVARRIAHEIKNPLTPIQLSAERIRRRFGKIIPDEDKHVFDQCTDTIVRQVGDIGRMVDEFSTFARMPKPEMSLQDLRNTVREAAFLVEVSRNDFTFERDMPEEPLMARYDDRLVGQAIGNVVKNAAEAIEARLADDPNGPKGHIRLVGRRGGSANQAIIIDVMDNGRGLPKENRNKLLEPYMTTREKGTGLGLAIVRKIVEDHGGRMALRDAPQAFYGGRGAMVRMIFLAQKVDADKPSQHDFDETGHDVENTHLDDVEYEGGKAA